MPKIYRAMLREGNRPKIGNTADTLGVRIGPGVIDIGVSAGAVVPGTGGMSVAPAWRDLPIHRIPRRLVTLCPGACGKNDAACWTMGEGAFEDGHLTDRLYVRVDTRTHGMVEPEESMTLAEYRSSLAATRNLWTIDEF